MVALFVNIGDCDKQKPLQQIFKSGLVGYGIAARIRMFPIQTLLGARPDLGTQPRYDASADLWVKTINTQWLTSVV